MDSVCQFFSDALERLLFKYMPTELEKHIGSGATTAMIFRIVKEATKNSAGDLMVDLMNIKDIKDALLACYLPYQKIGKPFEYEIVSENPLTVRVKKCPHYDFTEKKPLACTACGAIKAGIIERLTGKKVRLELENGRKLGAPDAEVIIKRTAHMPSGDEYCEFVIQQ
ncbi:hypothetical protein IPA_05540 [Ignicoccus pacificus DSM 13166]|uniref:Metanogen output domain-containing protein n=1 Tax=Ignicoccus pacificus DSM 13166 TaxID=940294 RepID=A0A977KCA5_9CREN|nr:hypothetical protein IPA_05540 [Ignicoccus pacificus DSM 13166]